MMVKLLKKSAHPNADVAKGEGRSPDESLQSSDDVPVAPSKKSRPSLFSKRTVPTLLERESASRVFSVRELAWKAAKAQLKEKHAPPGADSGKEELLASKEEGGCSESSQSLEVHPDPMHGESGGVQELLASKEKEGYSETSLSLEVHLDLMYGEAADDTALPNDRQTKETSDVQSDLVD